MATSRPLRIRAWRHALGLGLSALILGAAGARVGLLPGVLPGVLPVARVAAQTAAPAATTAAAQPTPQATPPPTLSPATPSAVPAAPGNVVVDPRLFQELKWRNVGPHRGGRVTAVAGVRTQPNVFYQGATGGGVWKTDDYGITWWPVSDGQIATGSIGAIAVSDSHPDVVYVGTGSQAIRSNVIIGKGMYKSVDAGKTWQFIGLRDTGQIGAVRIHPTNPDLVYVAALGSPFGPGPERGVFRTKDGGKSWEHVLKIDDRTGVVSLAMNWSKPEEIYAGAWRAERKGWTIISGGPAATGGIYKTTDGGDRWTHLTSGLPSTLIGKIWLDVAQSKPSNVYAMIEAPGAEGGLYRSSDAGATWSLASNDQRLRARPFYFNYVFVNPTREDEVWVNELRLHKSTNAGKTWTAIDTPHADNHAMWFNPDNPDIIVQGNDGGANVTQNGGRSWSSIMNQATAEFYMVDTDRQFPYRIYAPQQDNSTVVLASLPPFAWPLDEPTQAWSQASGCESGQIRPRPDGKIIYGDCKGEFGRYDVETGQEQHFWINPQQRYGLNPKDQRYRFVRQAPIEVDPHDPATVYHGSQYVHRTTDGGVHWQTISPDVTANRPETQTDSGEPITRDMTGEEVYSAIYALRASRLEPGVLWTGANDGPVWRTRDGGKTWKDVTPKDLPPGGRVHTIEDSPHRRGSAYVSVYRLYLNDFAPYLYVTHDYGATWARLTDGTNGIPADHPMHVVREDPQVPGLLYAGTWFGLFVSFDAGAHWQPLQQNLPATPVTDIKVHDNDLVIATMGRSLWIMDDVTPLRQLAAGQGTAKGGGGAGAGVTAEAAATLKAAAMKASASKASASTGGVPPFDASARLFLFSPAAAYRVSYAPQTGRVDRPEYPPIGARIDYHLAAAPSGNVTIEILDAAGAIVRTYGGRAARAAGADGPGMRSRRGGGGASMPTKKVGMNRFVWDLRYHGPWSANNPEGGPGGPLAAPGTYRVRVTADGVTQTQPVVVKIDPRLPKAGVTPADLVEQTRFSVKVRDSLSEANRLADRLRQVLDADGERAGAVGAGAAGAAGAAAGGAGAARGASAGVSGDTARLRALYDKLVNKPGAYPPNMLIAQFQNVARMVGQADQKIGASAYERYQELTKELATLKSQIDLVVPPTTAPAPAQAPAAAGRGVP